MKSNLADTGMPAPLAAYAAVPLMGVTQAAVRARPGHGLVASRQHGQHTIGCAPATLTAHFAR